ncbi:hypothetical protein A2U01_0072717, partial [Trifolium medium]|nr:hypothetical protein [Trifolium medium]
MGTPSYMYLKFNVDGAHSKKNDFSACGGLLRDTQGDLIQVSTTILATIILR